MLLGQDVMRLAAGETTDRAAGDAEPPKPSKTREIGDHPDTGYTQTTCYKRRTGSSRNVWDFLRSETGNSHSW
ncbi:hypothetical protein DIPPA_23395 [Diplonema papillatum]|nr:hypothetical protein DIPPA_23395 [Diplonema papillatum]